MSDRWMISAALLLAAGAANGADFGTYDADRSGDLSRAEYDAWAGQAGTYRDRDLDDDGFIDEDEYDALGFDGDFAGWDADDNDMLDSNEYYDGVFDYYDENESGHWDGGEWDDAGEAGIFDM